MTFTGQIGRTPAPMPHPTFETLARDGWPHLTATDEAPPTGSVVITPDGEVWNRDDDWPSTRGEGHWFCAASYPVFQAAGGVSGRAWDLVAVDGAIEIRNGWAS